MLSLSINVLINRLTDEKCRSVFPKVQDDERKISSLLSGAKKPENIHIKEVEIREFWLSFLNK